MASAYYKLTKKPSKSNDFAGLISVSSQEMKLIDI